MNTDVADEPEVVYPESDGKPMAENTLQWDWMVKIVGELRGMYLGQNVFVAGDLFWYPVKGNPKEVTAPDAMVAFGRPPGYRGSYKQWLEAGVPPQVVFEVLSPSNTADELDEKRAFYEKHGVAEYYVIDPYVESYEAYRRVSDRLIAVPLDDLNGFESPLLKVRFVTHDGLRLVRPDGRPFQFIEERHREIIAEQARQAEELRAKDELIEQKDELIEQKERELKEAMSRLEAERLEKESLARQVEDARRREAGRAEEVRQQQEKWFAQLRQLGIDPATLPPVS